MRRAVSPLRKPPGHRLGKGNRGDLRPVPDFAACYETGAGDAVRWQMTAADIVYMSRIRCSMQRRAVSKSRLLVAAKDAVRTERAVGYLRTGNAIKKRG